MRLEPLKMALVYRRDCNLSTYEGPNIEEAMSPMGRFEKCYRCHLNNIGEVYSCESEAGEPIPLEHNYECNK